MPPPALTGHLTADSNASTLSLGGRDRVFPLCLLSVSVAGACGTLYLTSRRKTAFKIFSFYFYIFWHQIRKVKRFSISAINSASVSLLAPKFWNWSCLGWPLPSPERWGELRNTNETITEVGLDWTHHESGNNSTTVCASAPWSILSCLSLLLNVLRWIPFVIFHPGSELRPPARVVAVF